MSIAIAIYAYKSPVGELMLGAYEQQLCLADWRYRKQRETIDARLQKALQAEYRWLSSLDDQNDAEAKFLQQVLAQFEAYFNGQLTEFDLPLLMPGTAFQQQVWQALQKIPYGQQSSYLALAESMDKPSAVRAVANANGANGLSIIVPCHRIVGSDGSLVGYAGGLSAKKKLLDLEQGGSGSDKTEQSDLFASEPAL